MERYAAVLNYAIPFFMSLLVIERLVAHFKGVNVIHSLDTLSSLSSGVTNVIKDVLGLTFIIISYKWFLDHLAIIQLESTWLIYTLAFIGLDFAGYWNHRLQHKVNYFWNVHIIHHSSEEFNLACALRQPISSIFSTITFFLIPTALLGVPHEVVAIVAPLHLFAQYWYHTRLIGKLGFLEKIIVTPSHHRVHHAINKEYLDKNLSQIFIIWDKLFGTFQEELDNVPPVYGVKRPVRTWNPVIINFVHLWQLVKDAWYTRSFWDKLRIWFMPTGWRPRDVKFERPIQLIEDVYGYEKYHPRLSNRAHIWLWIQFVMVFVMMMHLFGNISQLSFYQSVIYGVFICMAIFSYATLMDKNGYAWVSQLIVAAIAMGLVLYQKDWFLLNSLMKNGHLLVIIYFWLSAIITTYFVFNEVEKNNPSTVKVAQ
ncbi:sterol desaturase family protein [Marinoscillum sp. MHG1-6]|uniref:sterol desaturase family protein n=1 Tax=Marinoscillum sp. MHG1-6 TaxID=2959627 RepID=UPI0021580E39|nr:sterol desaturase family protein [Marinoscillum sp. MHG1-6]